MISMISYLATLAPALMAFTVSAQITYKTYEDSLCSSSIILTGSIELNRCTGFSNTAGPTYYTAALEIGGIFFESHIFGVFFINCFIIFY